MSRPTVVIDALGCASEEEFWSRYVEAVKPEQTISFGRNFYAFRDAVEGGGPGWPGEVNLHFANLSSLNTLPNGDKFLQVFTEFAANCRQTKITWTN